MHSTSVILLALFYSTFAIQMCTSSESSEHIHIKLHVPQIIKKHTHTRTIYKHHFVGKGKSGKSLFHGPPGLQGISASPSTLKHSSPTGLKALPTLSESDSISLGFGKTGWRPSAAEYRASELNYVPKKMRLPKKQNPFKMLEVMAEAHAEGHELPGHLVKKYKPSIMADESRPTSEYIPDYMLGNSDVIAYNSDDNSASDSDASKADLIYIAPGNDRFKPKRPTFSPTKLIPTLATIPRKKPKMAYDWIPAGTIAAAHLTASTSISSTSSDSESEDESELKHHLHMLKRNKSRKPKRLASTLGPAEEHINILQMTRKPYPVTNYTKFKNRLSGTSNRNTSV